MTSNHVNENDANDEVEEEPCEEQKQWLSQPFGIEPEAAQDQRIMELRSLAEIENNRRGGGKDATETKPSTFVHVEEESRNRRERTVLRNDMNTAEQEAEKAGSGIRYRDRAKIFIAPVPQAAGVKRKRSVKTNEKDDEKDDEGEEEREEEREVEREVEREEQGERRRRGRRGGRRGGR